MNKTLIFLGVLSIGLAHAQTGRTHTQHNSSIGRVGVNTEKPVASLEIFKLKSKKQGQVEGFLLPHLSQTERNTMTKEALVNGLMIFNTDKNCIDWWNGSHWQCTDGSQKDEHSDTYKKNYTATATYNNNGAGKVFTKTDCPAGQIGSNVTYKETATGSATSAVSMQDAQDKALADAKAKFEAAGQAYANRTGTCTSTLPPTTSITMPTGITISNGQYWIASIYDEDYLPYTVPTQLADWASTAPIPADGKLDKIIDFQGKIPAAGLTIQIPVTATGSNTLPAYRTSVLIPAERTQDNQARILTLSWEAQTFTTNTKTITAKLTPNNGTDLNIKKLDLKGGLGSDYRGLELATFKMPKSSADGRTPANYTGVYEVRAISGIPDKKFGVETNGQLEHQFIYLPMQGPDGKVWLNNNLGADYANINSPDFNPTHQAGARDYLTGKLIDNPTAEQIQKDYRAFGSSFFNGRDSDGHELVRYTSNKNGAPIHQMTNGGGFPTGNVCPDGWTLPSISIFNNLIADKDFHLRLKMGGWIRYIPDIDMWGNLHWHLRYVGYMTTDTNKMVMKTSDTGTRENDHGDDEGIKKLWENQWRVRDIKAGNDHHFWDSDWHGRCVLVQ